MTYINSDEPFEYENGTATLKFAYDKETCTQNYMAYENIMNEALSLIKESDSDWEKIAKLYIYVSDKNLKFNDLHKNIETIFDEKMTEGFKVEYKGKIYDYSI